MSSLDGLLGRIGVQPAERAVLGFGALCLGLLGAASLALLNSAETLFLKRVGVEALPAALLASAGLLVLTTSAAGRLASADPTRWMPRILLVLALSPLPFVLLAGREHPALLGGFVLVARQVFALGLLASWLALGSLVPARRAKQLFAPLSASVTLGAIVGSFGSGPLARVVGVEGLIAACSLVLAGAALAAVRLCHAGTRQLDHTLGRSAAAPMGARLGLAELFRTQRLFRHLFVALLCGGLLSPVLYFQFASVLDAATVGPDAEQQLLRLYSHFRGWVNVAMLGSQAWLSAVLYRRIGLPLSLSLWPVAYLLGFGWIGLDFTLVAAFTSFGAARVTEDGIADSAARIVYNLFPDEIRSAASGVLEGPVNRLGGMVGNALVLVALAFGAGSAVGLAAMPVAGLWLVSALLLWRQYPALLLQASAEHGLGSAGADRATLVDGATLRSVATRLSDPDPRVCRAAVDLVADGEPQLAVRLLAEAIETAPASNRPLLVETLQRRVESAGEESAVSEEALRAVARGLLAQPPFPATERADLLQVHARLSSAEGVSEALARESARLLDRALGDREAPVRLVAVTELHRRGAPPIGLPDLDRTLAAALTASDAMVRRSARKELRAILAGVPDGRWEERLGVLAAKLERRADRADTAEALCEVARRHGERVQPVAKEALRFAEDRDPRVRGALLALAGHAGLRSEGPRLVSALGAREPAEARGAHEGLIALGTEAPLPLLVGLEFGAPAQREAVVSVLRELEVDASTLDKLRSRQLRRIQAAVLHRAAVEAAPGGAGLLLRRRLDERISEGLGALLDLVAALHEDTRLVVLERRLRRSPTGRNRDVLIEAVESLLSPAERAAIVPLLEAGSPTARVEAAAEALGRPQPEPGEALAELSESGDRLTCRLADIVSLEGTGGIGDPASMPSAMDIAVRLQQVPVFDRLSTPQLVALAGLLQEQKAAFGERVYTEGEEGRGLYFVLEGEIELRRGALVLERLGPDSFFGELSSLDGVPRAEDAIARAETRLLLLDRDDLLALLEEAPALAIGLSQALSARVRRLTDRLEEALSPGREQP